MQISPLVTYACGPSVTGIVLLLLQFRQVKLHKAQITTLNVTYRKPFNRGYYNTGLGVQNFLNVITSKETEYEEYACCGS